MMTIQEIERACNRSETLDFSRHDLQTEELRQEKVFFPFGFPVEVKTNSMEVFSILEELWGRFEQQHETPPVRCEVHVVKTDGVECPPAPTYRIMTPLLMSVADGDNYSIVDLERNTTTISVSETALGYRQYASYFLLAAPLACIATKYTTPVHAACVALNGRGVMLCGDSGAGKSTLSYACARSGWTYISDDASFLLHDGADRSIAGNCHQVRFRPASAEFFPEIQGMEITPRAAGKPSVEMPTLGMPHLTCSQTARIDYIVFLNRFGSETSKLVPYRKDVARYSMRQTLYGVPETIALQYDAIDRLLTAEVFELHYRDLGWAVERLRVLVQEGS